MQQSFDEGTRTWLGDVAPFRPWLGLARPHLQTIVGPYLPSRRIAPRQSFRLPLPDGDTLTVHENVPNSKASISERSSGRPTILVSVHGLAGCHRSPYIQRLAWWATQSGWFSYRMDLRGAGDSGLDTRYLYHAGRSDDVLTVLRFVRQRHPNGRIFLCGFSLGASITLHLLANQLAVAADDQDWSLPFAKRGYAPMGVAGDIVDSDQSRSPAAASADLIDGAIAVCPPLDLALSARHIQRGINRLYDQVFARALWRALQERPRARQELGSRLPLRRPATLWDFDQQVTAPLGGFPSAEVYYRRYSTHDQVQRIAIPTLVLIAQDDPLIPFETAEQVRWSTSTKVVVTPRGGHLGFIGRSNGLARFQPTRWLEKAIVDSIQSHLSRTDGQSCEH